MAFMPILPLSLLAFAAAVAITLASIALALRSGFAWRIVDKPNHRSMHSRATPRTGGLCFVPLSLAIAGAAGGAPLWPLLLLAFALSVMSLCDDIWNLPAGARFSFHLVTAALVLLIYPLSSLWLSVLAIFALIWMTNLFNFMDGLDGFAGGMALIGFGSYGVAAILGGNIALAVVCAALAGGAGAFLLFNFNPARIFMGDAGSIPLGFLAGAIGIAGMVSDLWKIWFPVLVFSPFIVDATVTLLRRLARAEKVWRAHRTHYYQRLAVSRFGQRRTSNGSYVVMLCAGASAVLLNGAPSATVPFALACWALFYALLLIFIDLYLKRLAPVSNPD